MAPPPVRIWTVAFALTTLIIGQNVGAKDVRVLSFSFEVPDSWEVEGNGGDKLFAKGGDRNRYFDPPWILSEGCVPYKDRDCSTFRRPDLERDMPGDCAGVVGERVSRNDAIIETRWVCPSVMVDGLRATLGAVFFEASGAVLYIAYMGRQEDLSAAAFLDKLSHSLKTSRP